MKITKRQLRRVISEELASTAGDLYVNLTPEQEDALNDLEVALTAAIAAGVKEADMRDTVETTLLHGPS